MKRSGELRSAPYMRIGGHQDTGAVDSYFLAISRDLFPRLKTGIIRINKISPRAGINLGGGA